MVERAIKNDNIWFLFIEIIDKVFYDYDKVLNNPILIDNLQYLRVINIICIFI